MTAPEQIEEQWLKFEKLLSEKMVNPSDLDEVLFFIGIRESGLPPKQFSETEKLRLKELGQHSILAMARYYELIWVDDQGWPHFRPLQHFPAMARLEKAEFFKPYLIMYALKNRLIL
jgi:hypothetical protein